MSAIRLPLLCAFAGGCLSGAVLLGIWQADRGATVPAHKKLARHVEHAALASTDESPALPPESAEAPLRAPSLAAAHAEPPVSAEPEAPAVAGSAVSDVLTDLETAYRRRLAAAAAAEAPTALERTAAPASQPSNAAIAPVEPPPEAVAPAVAPVAVVTTTVAPPVAAAPVAPPVAAPPVAAAPVAAAPVAVALPVAVAPALVAQADSRPPDVHYGDVNNTYITNVRQGDVYVMQQQIAMMQYMQLLGVSSAGGRASGHVGRGMAPQTPHYRQFPSTLTNPDNPWGLDFAPLNLVH